MVLLTFVYLSQCACNSKNIFSTTASSKPKKAFQNHAQTPLDVSAIEQWWAISIPRATCGPPQHFHWPANAFRKNLKLWNFLQLSAEANVSETCFYFH